MKIEVVGMAYRSPEFFEFMAPYINRAVLNDPTAELLAYFDNRPLGTFIGLDLHCHDFYADPNPSDHYLSRVYRCWNYCVESSNAEYVCLVNSDMAFSPGWLEALERRLDGRTLPCSRLVEPGFIKPGQHAIEIDLGRDPTVFPQDAWNAMAADLREDRVEPGGLFMPCVLHRETFLEVGGYPHGNVNGVSGDAILFEKMAQAGYQHVTCFDSLVYHMQEGEMRYAL